MAATEREGDHRRWRCGEAAQAALSRLVSGRQVHCAPAGKDDAGTIRATCTIGKTDVAAALVEGGHVLAESGLMPRYRSEQAKAEQDKAGMWAGGATPERPEAWRKRLWNEARAKAPEGCPIKGKVAGRRGDTVKTYHLPWSPTYMRLRVVSARGERWFCSEADARAAGVAPGRADGSGGRGGAVRPERAEPPLNVGRMSKAGRVIRGGGIENRPGRRSPGRGSGARC